MSSGPIRRPAVAGQFYAAGHDALVEEIAHCYENKLGPGRQPTVDEAGPRNILGLLSPHAGYMYSGPVAAHGYFELALDGCPQHIIIIGPSHRWGGSSDAVTQTSGAWQTPLGWAQIDTELAVALTGACPELADSMDAFAGEHSLEVQLPFLQHIYGEGLTFLPIMMAQQNIRVAERIGRAIGEALAGEDVVIIASSDMTHFEPADVALEQDTVLLDRMLELDARGLIHQCDARGITMCGPGPAAAMIIASQLLGATRAEIVAYGNSGEIMPSRDVVAYLSLKVVKQ